MKWTDDRRQWRRSKVGAVKKSTKRKAPFFKIAINVAILLALFAMAGVYFFVLPNYPVRHVLVEHGTAKIDEIAVRDVVSPQLRHGFFHAHVNTIQQQLLQLPWVKTAIISKKWPDRLLITLTTHTPIAVWNKGAYLLDNGAVYQTSLVLTAAPLPQVNSPQNDGAKLVELYYAFNADLSTVALNIATLNETNDGEYVIILNNNIALNLGDTDLQQRVHRFVKTYPVELEDKANDIAYVDLRYGNGLAVGWRQMNQKIVKN